MADQVPPQVPVAAAIPVAVAPPVAVVAPAPPGTAVMHQGKTHAVRAVALRNLLNCRIKDLRFVNRGVQTIRNGVWSNDTYFGFDVRVLTKMPKNPDVRRRYTTVNGPTTAARHDRCFHIGNLRFSVRRDLVSFCFELAKGWTVATQGQPNIAVVDSFYWGVYVDKQFRWHGLQRGDVRIVGEVARQVAYAQLVTFPAFNLTNFQAPAPVVAAPAVPAVAAPPAAIFVAQPGPAPAAQAAVLIAGSEDAEEEKDEEEEKEEEDQEEQAEGEDEDESDDEDFEDDESTSSSEESLGGVSGVVEVDGEEEEEKEDNAGGDASMEEWAACGPGLTPLAFDSVCKTLHAE